MNFKRKKCRRQVRSTTQTWCRWLGNTKKARCDSGRFKVREYERERVAREEVEA